MKRRSLLQGLALLIPGFVAAPAIAKEVLAPAPTMLKPGVYVKEFDVRPVHPNFDFVEVHFEKLQEEVLNHPLSRAGRMFPEVANILMRDKQKATSSEGKFLRLVFQPEHRRAMPGALMADEDGYYYHGGVGIRYLAAEIVVRDHTMQTENVIKSRCRGQRVYTFKELMAYGTA